MYPCHGMVSLVKTLQGSACAAVVLACLSAASLAAAAPEEAPAARESAKMSTRMSLIPGKDVTGSVYKKLALPSVKYCWDMCVKEQECSGARWGVIQGDVAGLCVMLRGELTLKALAAPQTDEGKPIHVTAAKKLAGAGAPGT